MDAAQALTALAAFAGLGLGIVNSSVQLAAYRRERTSVEVTGGCGHRVYPQIEPDEPEMAWITATNTGRHPVTVDRMEFVSARSQTISMMDPRHGDEVRVLQAGEWWTIGMIKTDVKVCLEPGDYLKRAVVSGPGGRRWTGPVYDNDHQSADSSASAVD